MRTRYARWTGVGLLAAALSAQTPSLREVNDSFVRLAEKLTPAVVLVESHSYRPEEGGGAAAVALRQSTGSGVIVSADGDIVTNAHVVAGATRVRVQLSTRMKSGGTSILPRPGVLIPARVVGLDLETDLALLRIEASGLQFLSLADSEKVKQGQLVLALGNPLGLENSVSMGVVSSVTRQLRPDDRVIYLQTDAPINPGNSGGPLVDIDGNVIGINTIILSQSGGSEGLGFAVPSNIVRSVTGQLRRNGSVTRGDIGVEAQTITPALAAGLGLAREDGVVLADVTPNGPADNAGLRIGDIVLALNGKPMENARQFHVNLYYQPVAATVRLAILRGKGEIEVTVVVLDRREDSERLATLTAGRRELVERLGILAIPLDEPIIELLGRMRRSYGILVASLAARPGGPGGVLAPNDVIYTVNGQPVSTLPELRSLLEKAPVDDTVILQVERGGKIRYVEVPVE